MPFTIWNTAQACVWIASRDDVAVSSLPENYTFAALAFHVELELIDSDDDHAVVIDKGMTFGQLHELRDQMAEYFGPQEADRPGTAWIGSAQKELLAACGHAALKMTGRSLYGGPSREISAEAFATFRFFERDGVDCLGPPDLVDADCWRDLRLQAEDVRRVWPADRTADATSSPSIPAIPQLSPADGEQPENFEQKSEQTADQKHAPRRAGAKRFQRAAVLDYLNEQYPDGVPEEVSARSIQTALEAQGKAVSLRTIRRAIGGK
jgi:hypothetical protein